jgi:predicted metalloprotease with PDZ domain
VSFYSKGALVSLLLDMEIRRRSGHRASLDDLMRALFERYPLSGPGYTPEDVVDLAEELAGSSMQSFFDTAVRGTGELDFESALSTVGLELRFKPARRDDGPSDGDEEGDDRPADRGVDEDPPMKAYLGLRLTERGGRAVVRTVLTDGPAWKAGLVVDDEIVALDSLRLTASDLDERLERYEPGDRITLHLLRRDENGGDDAPSEDEPAD